jgi:hypothetical protein
MWRRSVQHAERHALLLATGDATLVEHKENHSDSAAARLIEGQT